MTDEVYEPRSLHGRILYCWDCTKSWRIGSPYQQYATSPHPKVNVTWHIRDGVHGRVDCRRSMIDRSANNRDIGSLFYHSPPECNSMPTVLPTSRTLGQLVVSGTSCSYSHYGPSLQSVQSHVACYVLNESSRPSRWWKPRLNSQCKAALARPEMKSLWKGN